MIQLFGNYVINSYNVVYTVVSTLSSIISFDLPPNSRWSPKEPTSQCRRHGFDPWVGKIPWRRAWQLTPVFLPGESPGQRSLVGCSPWVAKSETQLKRLGTNANSMR